MPVPEDILYEDTHFLILNKREFRPVQEDRSGDPSLLKELLEDPRWKMDSRGGITHRLDRPVLGVIVFARTGEALAAFNRLLVKGPITKIYWAAVEKEPPAPEGILKDWLVKDGKRNLARVVKGPGKGAKEAHLEYRVLGKTERYWLLEIHLITGRHHQIRVQLAHMGCPVKGDVKYGARRSNPGGGIHLFSRRISFPHPFTGKPVTVTAEPPEDPLWNCFPREEAGDESAADQPRL